MSEVRNDEEILHEYACRIFAIIVAKGNISIFEIENCKKFWIKISDNNLKSVIEREYEYFTPKEVQNEVRLFYFLYTLQIMCTIMIGKFVHSLYCR